MVKNTIRWTPAEADIPRREAPLLPGKTTNYHWLAPDIRGDLLAVARQAGAAEPVEIRVRPELYARIVQQARDEAVSEQDAPTDLADIPLVVDADLPAFPGYEIHRAPVRRAPRVEWSRTTDSEPAHVSHPLAA
jgi:hypothetical protein